MNASLSKIKSSGIYRFTYDKSVMPNVISPAETMRMMIGYSNKGPFNKPVYIEKTEDFVEIFGNISKRMEKKGVFFHRSCLDALSNGPIYALNLKPFDTEKVEAHTFDASNIMTYPTMKNINVKSTETTKGLYNTNKFWYIDTDKFQEAITSHNYITISATDTKDNSCTLFVRPIQSTSSTYSEYDLTIREWYASGAQEVPEYLESILDKKLNDYFAEVYVFRGEFKEDLIKKSGVLGKYFASKIENYKGEAKTVEGKTHTDNDWLTTKDGAAIEHVVGDIYMIISEGEYKGKYYKAAQTGWTEETAPKYIYYIDPEYKDAYGQTTDALAALASDENSNFISSYVGTTIPYFKNANGSYISLDIIFNAGYDSHKMVMKLDEQKLYDATSTTIDNLIKTTSTTTADLRPWYFKGYEYDSIGSTDSYIEKSLGVLKDGGVLESLTNHVDSEYHYLVDTFGWDSASITDAATNGFKSKITNVARKKDNALALIAWPSVDFLVEKGCFEIKNGKLAKKNGLKLPSDNNGASWAAYFTPIVISDGTVKTTIPSASSVSNLFMDKLSSRQMYDAVAGPNYSRLYTQGLVGPDYNYSRADLDLLEPMGVNVIVYVPRQGTFINSNQTAKQTPVSALSKIHVRELVIYIQDAIEDFMHGYQWSKNTKELRDHIKEGADAILENVKSNGGVTIYLNTCNDSNNTQETIDNEMLILDTDVEPARCAGKLVQRLTLHRTGGMTTTTV